MRVIFILSLLAACETNTQSVNTASCQSDDMGVSSDPFLMSANALELDGRNTFRFDTFGDQAFWGDALKLHQAIAGSANGGVGAGVSPRAALGLGLKVDVDALSPQIVRALRSGSLNLDDPANTVALLKANAVVGLTGFFDGGKLSSIG